MKHELSPINRGLMSLLEQHNDSALSRPLSREILLIDLRLADTPWSEELEKRFADLPEGLCLKLLRQPISSDDPAIKAYMGSTYVGTIPMEHTVILARLMDAGKELKCSVERVDSKRDFMSGRPWLRILVKIYLID